MLAFRPAILRDGETPLELTLPMVPWQLRSGGVGNSNVSAAGVPESYEIRRDRIAAVTVRVEEGAELDAVMLALEEIRASSESFTFMFDQDDDYSAYAVYLHSPVWPAEIVPTRDGDYAGAFRLAFEVRTTDGSPFLATWVEASA